MYTTLKTIILAAILVTPAMGQNRVCTSCQQNSQIQWIVQPQLVESTPQPTLNVVEGSVKSILKNNNVTTIQLTNTTTPYYVSNGSTIMCDGKPAYFNDDKYKGGLKVKLTVNQPYNACGLVEFFTENVAVVTVKSSKPPTIQTDPNVVEDALDEVNSKRMQRGMRPFIRDEGLRQAALSCAKERAARRIGGHLPSREGGDFKHLPPGTQATAAGCADLEISWGWQSCCWDDNHTYAGAAYVIRDGKRYNHIFVR